MPRHSPMLFVFFSLVGLLARVGPKGAEAVAKAPHTAQEPLITTFSIVAYDPETGSTGLRYSLSISLSVTSFRLPRPIPARWPPRQSAIHSSGRARLKSSRGVSARR